MTEHKYLEEAERRQHALLNNVIESLSHPFYVVNIKDYTIELANKNAGEWLKGKTTCYQLSHKRQSPCGTNEHICPIEEIKRVKKPLVIEHLHLNQKGEPRTVEVFAYPIFNDQGEVYQIIEYAIDITERKQAELKIENSLSLLQATLESSSDAMLVVDLNNTWSLYNQKFIDLWHIPDDIIAAQNDNAALSFVLNQLEDAEGFLNKVQELYHTPEANSFDIIQFKNGKIVERYSIPQRINGEVIGRVWSFRDITERAKAEQALYRESEKNLALLRNASDGIHILDIEGNIIEASDSFCAMLGYSRDEVIAMNVTQWDTYFSTDEVIQVVKRQFEKPVRALFETRHRCKDGSIIDVEVSGFPLKLDGKPVLFNSSRDITERKHVENKLRESQALLQTAQRAAKLGHYVMDLNDCNSITWTNDAQFDEIFGLDEHFIRNFANLSQIIHPKDLSLVENSFLKLFEQSTQEQTDFIEHRIIRLTDGEERWIGKWARTFYDEQGNPVRQVGMIQDITERKATEDYIHHLAFYDHLTQLPNRRLLQERLQHGIEVDKRTGSKMGLLMMDLDKFKAVNDSLGHAAGDELLQQVAKRVKDKLRKIDMVARLGGDEFMIVIENVECYENAARVAEIIIDELSQPFILFDNHQVSIGASIGIAIHPEHGSDANTLTDNADTALYDAKNRGRGCFACFGETLVK